MQCRNPKMTKVGIVVGCGKCELCKSKRRNEWSIRLGIECKYSDRMPLFLTLTYDNEHLPYVCLCDNELSNGKVFTMQNTEFRNRCEHHEMTLHRADISGFLKEYKRVNKLDNDSFHYFGCGEYGDQGRPHYHLLFFGDDNLQKMFDDSAVVAADYVQSIWKNGIVHVCQASFAGVHYVTKYCLKEEVDNLVYGQVLPFTIASKNLGSAFFDSDECYRITRQLDYLYLHKDEIYSKIGIIHNDKNYLKRLIYEINGYFPKFETSLDDGRKVYLPRYFRKHIVGSFDHFKDSPLWVLEHIQKLYDGLCYYEMFSDYDRSHKMNAAYESMMKRIDQINKRLTQKKHNKPNNRKYEGI